MEFQDFDHSNVAAASVKARHLAEAPLFTLRPTSGELRAGTTLGSVTTSYTYNGFGELQTMQAKFGASLLYSESYTRDALGRIVTRVETMQGVTTTYQYGYDAAGRLETVTKNGSLASQYAYDANGNRLSKWTPTITETGTYDAQDRMLTYAGATYTYTANGETLTKTDSTGTTSYQYDVFGNLLGVDLPNGTQIRYKVDGRNRRIERRVNGSVTHRWLWQGQLSPIAELDGTNALRSRLVYATRVNVPDFVIRSGVTYRVVTDHLGSPRLLVNTTTGAAIQRMDFDEWGIVTSDTNPGWQPFGFAGGMHDDASKLARFGARDLHPTAGRWSAKDPLAFYGGDANLYLYAAGNPVDIVDPTGLALCKKQLPYIGWTYLDDEFSPPVDKFLRNVQERGLDDLKVTSAFRTSKQQQDLFADPAGTGATTPARLSLHEAGWAIDINYRSFSPEDQASILQAARDAGLSWGGNFLKPDDVHFYVDPVNGDLKKRKELIDQAQSEYQAGGACECE